MRYGKELV